MSGVSRVSGLNAKDRGDLANPENNVLMLGPVRFTKWREQALKEIDEAGWEVRKEVVKTRQLSAKSSAKEYWFKVERKGWRTAV